VQLAEKTRALPIESVELVPSNGVDVVRPDFDEIHSMVGAALAATAETPAP
jgi:hypothetical protein